MKRRVVVTGLGAVTPLGIGVEASWQSLCQGKSGIGPVTKFDASGSKVGNKTWGSIFAEYSSNPSLICFMFT